jgi:hypothetical protein
MELVEQAGQQPRAMPGSAVLRRGGELQDLGRGQGPAEPPLGLAVQPHRADELAPGLQHPELARLGPLHVLVGLGPHHQA